MPRLAWGTRPFLTATFGSLGKADLLDNVTALGTPKRALLSFLVTSSPQSRRAPNPQIPMSMTVLDHGLATLVGE